MPVGHHHPSVEVVDYPFAPSTALVYFDNLAFAKLFKQISRVIKSSFSIFYKK
jgi:hypothetical protein